MLRVRKWHGSPQHVRQPLAKQPLGRVLRVRRWRARRWRARRWHGSPQHVRQPLARQLLVRRQPGSRRHARRLLGVVARASRPRRNLRPRSLRERPLLEKRPPRRRPQRRRSLPRKQLQRRPPPKRLSPRKRRPRRSLRRELSQIRLWRRPSQLLRRSRLLRPRPNRRQHRLWRSRCKGLLWHSRLQSPRSRHRLVWVRQLQSRVDQEALSRGTRPLGRQCPERSRDLPLRRCHIGRHGLGMTTRLAVDTQLEGRRRKPALLCWANSGARMTKPREGSRRLTSQRFNVRQVER